MVPQTAGERLPEFREPPAAHPAALPLPRRPHSDLRPRVCRGGSSSASLPLSGHQGAPLRRRAGPECQVLQTRGRRAGADVRPSVLWLGERAQCAARRPHGTGPGAGVGRGVGVQRGDGSSGRSSPGASALRPARALCTRACGVDVLTTGGPRGSQEGEQSGRVQRRV